MIRIRFYSHKWFYGLSVTLQIRRLEWYRARKRLRRVAELARKAATSREAQSQMADDYEISVRVIADIHWKKPPANFTEEMQRQQARLKIAAIGRDLDETAKVLLLRNLPTGDSNNGT